MQGSEHLERAVDVLEHEFPVDVVDAEAVGRQTCELVVVLGRTLYCLLEDRRIRGEPADPALNQVREVTTRQVSPSQIVDPRTLPVDVEETL